jgi:23S rRNA (cytosine1962-C5)-methyltransferase
MNYIYKILDSGEERKLEQLGDLIIDRPCAQAFWPKMKDERFWNKADVIFERGDNNIWHFKNKKIDSKVVKYHKYFFKLKFTDFGHIGIFPEHKTTWELIEKNAVQGQKMINLFGYTGGATIAGAASGALVTHVDASQKINDWAKENIELNNLDVKSVRWITDDVIKFLKREVKRGNKYDAFVMDPPTFGRGSKGEVFKIERDLSKIMELVVELMSEHCKYVILSCHTPGFTPKVLENILFSYLKNKIGKIFCEELLIPSDTFDIPSGAVACWVGK